MVKQSLFILTGLPYAGKTTLRNQLVDKYGFSSVSVDEVIDREGFDTDTMTQEQWNFAYSEAYRNLTELLSSGKTVVVDIGNLKRSERDTARSIGHVHAVDTKLIYVDTSRQDVIKRQKKNEETQERGQLTEFLLNRAFDMFEPPTPDEKPIVYKHEMRIEEWMEIHVEGIGKSSEGNPRIL